MINKLLPLFLVLALGLLGSTVYFATRSGEDTVIHQPGASPTPGDLQKRASGIPGDRDDPLETIRTLTELQEKTLKEAEKDRKANEEMRNNLSSLITQGVNEKVKDEMEGMKAKVDQAAAAVDLKYKSQIAELERELRSAKSQIERNAKRELPKIPATINNKVASISEQTLSDFGFDSLAHNDPLPQNTARSKSGGYVSIKPLGLPSSAGAGEDGNSITDTITNATRPPSGLLNNIPDALNPSRAQSSTNTNRRFVQPPSRNNQPVTGSNAQSASIRPMFTIPQGSTLFENTTMTAILGKVPFGRTVTNPFRFKVVTGTENYAANRHLIPPEVSHIIWTGYSTGNRPQSCAQGYLDTVTMVFNDGTISTTSLSNNDRNTSATDRSLAYITDPWGKPCIQGQLYDNGTQFLADRVGVAAIGAAAQGAAIAETEVEDDDGRETVTITGDVSRFIAGQALSGAAEELLDFTRERAVDSVDLVYIPTGIPVTIHVESEIRFDYNEAGRKLSHAGDHAAGRGDTLD